ncbi:hypothetical protein A6R68_06178 [Neotoma lepida]|uniref:SHSP domain-containing protein n=1 Tax=Neotoma lepida TaxID=56216 RepID=A0A1A6GHL3_NEOLE|nr:hypothetical protein A6R68_06178 [Neotoma lepida]
MQRVGSSLSTRQQELGENRVASRCPSVASAERNQVATLPVRLLKDDLASVQGNGRADAGFQLKMDAYGFAPGELIVRVDGQNLTVTGQKQEESNDPVRGRYRMEQTVHQQTKLPPNVDPAAMTCSLTPSGHLWESDGEGLQPDDSQLREELPVPSPAQGLPTAPGPRPLPARRGSTGAKSVSQDSCHFCCPQTQQESKNFAQFLLKSVCQSELGEDVQTNARNAHQKPRLSQLGINNPLLSWIEQSSAKFFRGRKTDTH